jgi:two-component system response regulator YesN
VLSQNKPIHQAVCNFLKAAINFNFSPQPNLNPWFEALLRHGENIWVEQNNEDRLHRDWIQQVIRYVNENYMNEIGIGQIAGQFRVTPNYLSSLFHKKHGITFMKFLTETRMHNAKELLLKNPNLKIQQVAE